jgi:hypothetical protein
MGISVNGGRAVRRWWYVGDEMKAEGRNAKKQLKLK